MIVADTGSADHLAAAAREGSAAVDSQSHRTHKLTRAHARFQTNVTVAPAGSV
jgi:hypothetical protein